LSRVCISGWYCLIRTECRSLNDTTERSGRNAPVGRERHVDFNDFLQWVEISRGFWIFLSSIFRNFFPDFKIFFYNFLDVNFAGVLKSPEVQRFYFFWTDSKNFLGIFENFLRIRKFYRILIFFKGLYFSWVLTVFIILYDLEIVLYFAFLSICDFYEIFLLKTFRLFRDIRQ